jgi:hypothetical protein
MTVDTVTGYTFGGGYTFGAHCKKELERLKRGEWKKFNVQYRGYYGSHGSSVVRLVTVYKSLYMAVFTLYFRPAIPLICFFSTFLSIVHQQSALSESH